MILKHNFKRLVAYFLKSHYICSRLRSKAFIEIFGVVASRRSAAFAASVRDKQLRYHSKEGGTLKFLAW